MNWRENGYVYFVRAGDTGPIKIGFSTSPASRIAQLQTAHDQILQLLAVVRGNRDFENWIHRLFFSLRKNGEWFENSDRILIFASALLKQQADDTLFNVSANRFRGWIQEEIRRAKGESK